MDEDFARLLTVRGRQVLVMIEEDDEKDDENALMSTTRFRFKHGVASVTTRFVLNKGKTAKDALDVYSKPSIVEKVVDEIDAMVGG